MLLDGECKCGTVFSRGVYVYGEFKGRFYYLMEATALSCAKLYDGRGMLICFTGDG